MDLKAYYEPVYAVADAVVKFAGWGNAEGYYIILNHGNAETVYCHLSRLNVTAGEIVNGGQVIGITGNTGRSTGPHLHWGVRY
ncbi:MAG: M23 family metallopeptidase [Niabella sp.]